MEFGSLEKASFEMWVKRTDAAIALATAALVVAGFLCWPRPKVSTDSSSLSLSFVRQGTELGYLPELAFLRLTNASNSSFLLTMTGDTNTFESSIITESSWMLNCVFGEQNVEGTWTNRVQLPAAVRGNRAYVSLAPFSGMLVRVLLPADGRVRRVGVVCEKVSPPGNLDGFFGTSFGRATLRLLPRSYLRQLATPPATIVIWCEKEISCVEKPGGGE